MNAILECEVVLSKKFEAVCDDGEPIAIHIMSVSGNKGRAIVRLTCKPGVAEKDLAKIGETSLMLKVVGASDDVRSLEDDTRRVGNLVGGVPTAVEAAIARTSPHVPEGDPYRGPMPVTDGVMPVAAPRAPVVAQAAPAPAPAVETPPAAPQPPPNPFAGLQGNPDAMKLLMMALAAAGLPVPQLQATPQGATVPAPAPAPKPQVRDNCIMSYDELMAELNSIPGVDNVPRMPTDRKLTPRETDMILSQMPRLRRKAYLRNNLQAQLMVGDLFTTLDGSGYCLALLPGAAFDLTRVPARNILNSTDLKWCFETGKVELVNTAMYAASFKKVQQDIENSEPTTLPVYSGGARTSPHDSSGGMVENIAAGSAMTDEKDAIHIGGQGPEPISVAISATGDEPPSAVYEESPQMQALIGNLPREKAPPPSQPRRVR